MAIIGISRYVGYLLCAVLAPLYYSQALVSHAVKLHSSGAAAECVTSVDDGLSESYDGLRRL